MFYAILHNIVIIMQLIIYLHSSCNIFTKEKTDIPDKAAYSYLHLAGHKEITSEFKTGIFKIC